MSQNTQTPTPDTDTTTAPTPPNTISVDMFRRQRLISPFAHYAYLTATTITAITIFLAADLVASEASWSNGAITIAAGVFFFLSLKKLATSTTPRKYAKHLKMFTTQLNPTTIVAIKKQLTSITQEDNTARHFHYTFHPDHTPTTKEIGAPNYLTLVTVDSEENDPHTYVTTHVASTTKLA